MPASQVLVVEADLSVRHALADILAREGAQVSLAGDGLSALALLEKKSFDVLVCRAAAAAHGRSDDAPAGPVDSPPISDRRAGRPGQAFLVPGGVTAGGVRLPDEALYPSGRSRIAGAGVGLRVPPLRGPGAAGGGCRGGRRPLGRRESGDACRAGLRGENRPHRRQVLLRGEPGTPVDLVAQAIHRRSRRAGSPLAHVVCKGIDEAELETVLFGHPPQGVEEGRPHCPGLLESARGGTLFLVNVEGLPLWAQVRLFDVFFRADAGHFVSAQAAPPDVRLIASTSCDLEAAVAEGRFYAGLYYLLNVTSFRVPSLRERRQDLKALVEYYLQKTLAAQGIEAGKTPWSFTSRPGSLLNHDWPGNLPELAGVVTHAVAVSDGTRIGEAAIAVSPPKPAVHGAETAAVLLSGNLQEIERRIIAEMIDRCGGNKAAAARALGLHRRTLYRMLEEGAGGASADPVPQGRCGENFH